METQNLKNKKDHPGVYVPPPLIYVLFFLLAVFMQKHFPLPQIIISSYLHKAIGVALILTALPFMITSLRQFYLSKNTVVTIMPAASLQTTGIYSISRNPMYVGLALIYLALSSFIGNGWNIALFPVLIAVVQFYIISREEKYLTRRFGNEYLNYKRKVRRWL